ncbi:methyltransferase type 12 [Hydrococcus rivularis NIES-593]|uniref:Methyltransferase type 12 n=1 Tax=Hydrococcus rivularis NIES-593 TaxID=1921803 RepID=A0A1U7H8X5_9CYAN|nr:class I SAM-dependent methyltransferase [Hydrococcus rivularis]OKH19828.1 methyltransferase type 12 [Hydrococcus rivularis NIES-593]
MESQTSSQDKNYEVWKNAELSKAFLEGVRGAIPLAAEQIDMLLRVIQLTQTKVENFLDLGCGNGILGRSIYQHYPKAKGSFLDISENMLTAAKNSLKLEQNNSVFILQNFGQKEWLNSVTQEAPFDVIVSGFAIHHLSDERKKELYQEIYQILKPGGVFLNLEHVASQSKLGEEGFDRLFVDALCSFHQKQGSQQSREEIARQYYNRSDKTANILTLVETQCQWLREIGFVDVDCFMKVFEIALFGGLRAKNS